MSKPKQAPEVEPYNRWYCADCQTATMTHAEMLTHLEDVHHLDTHGLQGTRTPIMHLDGETWYSWQYAVEIEGPDGTIHLENNVCQRRDKDDLMRYG